MEMLNQRDCDDDIHKIALQFYYNPSIVSPEYNSTSTLLLQNIKLYNPSDIMECGIITGLSFFIDKNFKVSCSCEELNNAQLEPGIPVNWRSSICTMDQCGDKFQIARFYIKLCDQQFELSFMFTSYDETVIGKLVHSVKEAAYVVAFPKERLNGLIDPAAFTLPFANSVVDLLSSAFLQKVIQKAALNHSPSCSPSPSYLPSLV
ncbi:uncharacterized protein LOC135836219 [Planococcus citri]|uniref:uncharacterized protein LOC135836219 n=1 Tax=Planococcus citri TaxID=170843 RepID=UPI0031F823C2